MLNYIWGGMIVLGIIVAALTGRLEAVSNAAVEQAKEGVNLTLILIGTMGMWLGLMKIAEASGLIEGLSKKMKPLLQWLFPEIPKNHKSFHSISMNMIANILGLGSAATPFGLKAMEDLQEINPKKDEANNAMAMFLIINISSLQLIPMNIIAYRLKFHSLNPSEIIGPGILATIFATVVGIFVAKLYERRTWK